MTAAHNLLALAHIGLGEGRLYVGSWSEWIVKHEGLVAKGALALISQKQTAHKLCCEPFLYHPLLCLDSVGAALGKTPAADPHTD